jgi:hypothetical protein
VGYPWYEVIENDGSLQQGDFLASCPVVVPLFVPNSSTQELEAEILEYNVVVMSQSCDLEQDKLDLVLVCPHWSLESMGEQNQYFKSSKGKEELRRGNVPGYHMLASCELSSLEREIQIVDFRNVYSIPHTFLKQFSLQSGNRLRLLPPYREHLSQAFARFLMRVGLPANIPPFK